MSPHREYICPYIRYEFLQWYNTPTNNDKELHVYLGRGKRIGILLSLNLTMYCSKRTTHTQKYQRGRHGKANMAIFVVVLHPVSKNMPNTIVG